MAEKRVSLDSEVTIKGKNLVGTFTIVRPEEMNVLEKKISLNSPLGKALLSHKVNETVVAKTPKGTVKYKILTIV